MTAPSPMPIGGRLALWFDCELLGRFVKVGAHDDGIANRHVAADAAAQADHAVDDSRTGSDLAAIGHEAVFDCRTSQRVGGSERVRV